MKKNVFCRRLASVIAMAVAMALLPSCAALTSMLPDVIAAVTDGAQILDAIENFVENYFLLKPNPEAHAIFKAKMTIARTALNAALRATQGVKNLDDKQIDAAFADFRAAYGEILALTKPYGVQPIAEGRMAASAGTLAVPELLAFRHGRKDGAR